ncbi:MAG: hypothetical protein WA823_03845 [Candidatus Acidiferrales bacterium]
MFRRAQAMLVVLALLAAPLALYARGSADAMPDCNGLCCLPHHHRAPQPTLAAQPAAEKDPECHHASATPSPESSHTCAFNCAMHGNPHSMNYGLLSPIAPTKPSNLAVLCVATKSQHIASSASQNPPTVFLASPFQPPRA